MRKLKNFMETGDTRAGRIFDMTIQFLIVLSLITFALETLPDISETSKSILHAVEVMTVIVFSIEYILRLIVADKKIKYIFSFHGLVDLAAILPFYITTGVDLRSIRVFRLFRLFMVLKFAKYNDAIKKFTDAFTEIKTTMIIFLMATTFILYVSGVGIYFFEGHAQPDIVESVFDGIWWAIITLTTVGYGDVHPITMGGKFITFVLLMMSIALVVVPTGLFTSALTKQSKS